VRGCSPPSPCEVSRTRLSRREVSSASAQRLLGEDLARARTSTRRRSSAMNWPNSYPPRRRLGCSSEDGRLRRALDRSTSSGRCAVTSAISSGGCAFAAELGQRLALGAADLLSFSTTCTGIRIVSNKASHVIRRSRARIACDPPGGVRRELKALAGNRTSRPRAEARACPPGSGRGTAGPVAVVLCDPHDQAAGWTRPNFLLASHRCRRARRLAEVEPTPARSAAGLADVLDDTAV